MVNKYTYLEMYLNEINKKISLREFEKYFNKPHQTIKTHLQQLVDEKILLVEKMDRFRFYSLNFKNNLLKEYLSICEKERLILFLNRNILFKRLYEFIWKHLTKNKVLIFGSAVDTKEFNDIDIFIISNDKKIRATIDEFMQTYSVKIHVVQSNEKNITSHFIKELKKKHIMLNEHDYFIEVLYKDELKMV